MGFEIKTPRTPSFTQIPDSFIRTYMLEANGNFVKVYLYILMAGQHPDSVGEVSVSSLADCMECTENDIRRALRYWQKTGLLVLSEKDGEITSVILSQPAEENARLQNDIPAVPAPVLIQRIPPVRVAESGRASFGVSGAGTTPDQSPKTRTPADDVHGLQSPDSMSSHETAGNKTSFPLEKTSPETPSQKTQADIPLPERHTYTPLQAEALQKDVEIDRAVGMVEQLLGNPVTPAHLQLILYFMCDIGFSSELLATLYQTALNKGKKQPKYIEAIGLSWARQGIHTPEEALEESANFNGRYALVARAFGIQGSLRPAERQIVDSWSAYQFSDAIIEEACKRTILSTGGASWEYVSTILQDWHDKHVISLSDIAKCDASHKRQKKGRPSSKVPPKKNQFQNFPQRTYSAKDFDSLEKQLLRNQKVKA